MPGAGSSTRDAQAARAERLAAELRANLKKRKAQARARAAGVDQAAQDAGVSDDMPERGS